MPDALWNHLIEIGLGAIMLWVVKTVQDMTVEMRAMRGTMFGETGHNGINGTVKQLRLEMDETKDRLNNVHTDVAVLKDRAA